MKLNLIALSCVVFFPYSSVMAQGLPAGSRVVEVKASEATVRITLGGVVAARTEVTLDAQMPGRIVELAGREGDAFEKNTLLVKIDDNQLQAKLRAAQASHWTATSQLHNAQVQWRKEAISPDSSAQMGGMGMGRLFDQIVSKPMENVSGTGDSGYNRYASMQQQEMGIQQAQSGILQAQAQIDQLMASLRDTETRAPFQGVIVAKFVEQGDTVQPGMPLLKFADRHLQVQVEVPVRLVQALRKDDIVPTRLDVSKVWGSARVERIFPDAAADQHTVTVKFDLPPDAPASRPGTYAEVQVPDSSIHVAGLPEIPKTAVMQRGSLDSVYVEKVGAPNKFEIRLVRLGDSSGNMVRVLSGVNVGERILDNPPITGLAEENK